MYIKSFFGVKVCAFCLVSKETTYITKIFKHSKLKIAQHINYFIRKNLNPKTHISNKYLASCIYKLTCTDCGKAYVGQGVRNFCKRYKEHLRAFRNNSSSSKVAQYLNDHIHLDPQKTPCKYCATTIKAHTLTPQKDFIHIKKPYLTTN